MSSGHLADRVRPFEALTDRYEAWFDVHGPAFEAEVAALAPLLGTKGPGLEVGVGTGRFAQALGVATGIDPSRAMARRARRRGIRTVRGVGEALPFADRSFERVLLVATLCYLADPEQALSEAWRVLTPDGRLALGFIDRDSPLGQRYETERASNPFYRPARFLTLGGVERLLERAGFETAQVRRTLSQDPSTLSVPEPAVAGGRGEGAFVALLAGPRRPDAVPSGGHGSLGG